MASKEFDLDELKFFCFDNLGDLIDPKDIEVKAASGGRPFVTAICRENVLPDQVMKEWMRQTQNTEFEGIMLLARRVYHEGKQNE